MNNSPQEFSLVETTLYDRYKIIKELGKGGFGQTFLAEDIQMPEKVLCVVKQLNPPSFEPQIVKKCENLFKEEALALKKLGKHPSIPELKAYFTYQQHFYLVQEYIEGNSLDEVMLNATKDEVIKIIEDVGSALVEVHNSNRIHRDVKPDNLIWRNSDEQIVLIDFGAVKEITTQIINEQGEVIKTVVIGTDGYMAPEQAQGKPCYASDIYSLGIVVIEKLIRKKPVTFSFDQYRNVSWIADLPVGVSVSDELAKVLNKMTRFSLSERYTNIQQVLADLQTIKDNDRTNILSTFSKNQPVIETENSSKNSVKQNSTSDLGNNRQSQKTQIKNSSSPIKKILITLPIILLLGIGFTIYKSINPIPHPKPNADLIINQWNTYKDNNNNFEFIYPQDWKLSKDPIAGDIYISYDQNEKIYDVVVSVDSLKENISLDRYSAFLTQEISNQESVSTPVTSSEQKIANREGRKIVYSTQNNNLEKQIEINFTTSNKKVYIIRVTTANFNIPQKKEITEKIIKSFAINN